MSQVHIGKIYRVKPRYNPANDPDELVIVNGFKYQHQLVIYSRLDLLNRKQCDSINVFTRVYELFEGYLK